MTRLFEYYYFENCQQHSTYFWYVWETLNPRATGILWPNWVQVTTVNAPFIFSPNLNNLFYFFVIFFFNSITLLCFLLMADSFGFRIMFLWKACVAVFEVCRNIQKLQRCQKTHFQIFENITNWVEVGCPYRRFSEKEVWNFS